MKTAYTSPIVAVTLFENADILTSSGENQVVSLGKGECGMEDRFSGLGGN